MNRGLLLSASLLLATAASAAPWIQPAGKGWLSLRMDRFVADVSAGPRGERNGADSYSLALGGSVGLPAQFELGFDVPYTVATNRFGVDTQYTNRAMGDARVYVGRSISSSIPLAAVVEAEIPLYQRVEQQGEGGFVEYGGKIWPVERFPDVGDGQLEVIGSLAIGHSFYPSPAWTTARVGYRFRPGPGADAIDLAADLGTWLWEDRLAGGFFATAIFNLAEDENPLVFQSRQFLNLALYGLLAVPKVDGLSLKLSAGTVILTVGGDPGLSLSGAVVYAF